MKVLLTGATGLIGQQLGIELVRAGHSLIVISRNKEKALLQLPFPAEVIEGDLMQAPVSLTTQPHAVIHLLGEGVATKRWNQQQKEKIFQSRTLSSENLLKSFQAPPEIWIQASAIGFYGDRKDELLTEDSTQGTGFLADVCIEWEKFAQKALSLGAKREVRARLGVVLSHKGGALEQMHTAFEAGVGGALGSGQQWMSWIHLQDVVQLFKNALEDSRYSGAINFVSPSPETNLDFSKKLVQTLHRPLGPKVPGFALKALFGEMADMLLASQKIQPQKAKNLNYQFQFPDLESALKSAFPGAENGEQLFEAQQFINKPRKELFPFFAKAENLERITPPFLNFKILKSSTPEVQKGTEIDYALKIHGVPAKWKTLIESFSPPDQFVDTALKSPYNKWHHTHTFEDLGSGTLMTDRVFYKLPMGYLGWLAGNPLVKKDVAEIFAYRRQAVLGLLNEKKS